MTRYLGFVPLSTTTTDFVRPGFELLRAANALSAVARTGIAASGTDIAFRNAWIELLTEAARLEAIARETETTASLPTDEQLQPRIDEWVNDAAAASAQYSNGMAGIVTPDHAISLAITDDAGQALLVRDPFTRKLRLPFTSAERDVTPQESAVRFAARTMGLEIAVVGVGAIETKVFPQSVVVETYTCRLLSLATEHPDLEWWNPSALEQNDVAFLGRFDHQVLEGDGEGFPLTEDADYHHATATTALDYMVEHTEDPILRSLREIIANINAIVQGNIAREEAPSVSRYHDLERWAEARAAVNVLARNFAGVAQSDVALQLRQDAAEIASLFTESPLGEMADRPVADRPKYGTSVVIRAITDDGQIYAGMVLPSRELFSRFGNIGGWVAMGESIKTAAVRELSEETGWDLAVDDVIALSPCPIYTIDRPFSRAEIMVTIRCQNAASLPMPPLLDRSEARSFHWLSQKEFFQLREQNGLVWKGAGTEWIFVGDQQRAFVPQPRAEFVANGNPTPFNSDAMMWASNAPVVPVTPPLSVK